MTPNEVSVFIDADHGFLIAEDRSAIPTGALVDLLDRIPNLAVFIGIGNFGLRAFAHAVVAIIDDCEFHLEFLIATYAKGISYNIDPCAILLNAHCQICLIAPFVLRAGVNGNIMVNTCERIVIIIPFYTEFTITFHGCFGISAETALVDYKHSIFARTALFIEIDRLFYIIMSDTKLDFDLLNTDGANVINTHAAVTRLNVTQKFYLDFAGIKIVMITALARLRLAAQAANAVCVTMVKLFERFGVAVSARTSIGYTALSGAGRLRAGAFLVLMILCLFQSLGFGCKTFLTSKLYLTLRQMCRRCKNLALLPDVRHFLGCSAVAGTNVNVTFRGPFAKAVRNLGDYFGFGLSASGTSQASLTRRFVGCR